MYSTNGFQDNVCHQIENILDGNTILPRKMLPKAPGPIKPMTNPPRGHWGAPDPDLGRPTVEDPAWKLGTAALDYPPLSLLNFDRTFITFITFTR